MQEFRLAIWLGITIIILQILARFVVHFRRRLLLLPPPLIVIIIGPHLSCKKDLAQNLQNRFRNSLRPFLHASTDEFLERLPAVLRPSESEGDPLFDAWYYVKNSDGSSQLALAERGARCVSGVHRSWSALVEAGNNMVIDYALLEDSLLTDLFTVFKKQLNRIVLIDLQLPMSLLDKTSDLALASFKRQQRKQVFPVQTFQCEVQSTAFNLDNLTDTVFKHVSQSGLV